jgi:hypothetical protein
MKIDTFLEQEEIKALTNLKVRPVKSVFLFCTRAGTGYMNDKKGQAPGFKSMWQRLMDRII